MRNINSDPSATAKSNSQNEQQSKGSSKKKSGHWRLKFLSLVLAVILWLILSGIPQAKNADTTETLTIDTVSII